MTRKQLQELQEVKTWKVFDETTKRLKMRIVQKWKGPDFTKKIWMIMGINYHRQLNPRKHMNMLKLRVKQQQKLPHYIKPQLMLLRTRTKRTWLC